MPIIFLDYGHGGNDSGAVCENVKEKDLNFQIGQRVKHHIERHGQTVIESRSDDTNPSLSSRSLKANVNNVDLAVSIHCNSFSDTSVCGLETYTYGKGTRELQLAKCVHNALIKDGLYTKNRGIKQGDLHMVREIKTASILVELGFISNKTDREMLLNNIEKYAESLARGILSFYDIMYSEDITKSTSKFYRVQIGAFAERKNADNLSMELRKKGYSTVIKYY